MRATTFILIIFFLAGCSPKNKVPAGVLSPQTMRTIIWDLMRADEYVNSYLVSKNAAELKTERTILYEQIFRLHAVDQKKFQKSLTFYQARPDLLKIVTDSLRSDERRVMEEQNKPKNPIIDSVSKGPAGIKLVKPN